MKTPTVVSHRRLSSIAGKPCRRLGIISLWLALAAVNLAGCATTPELVRNVQVVEKPVPVRERCIAAADVPVIPATHIPRAGDVAQRAAGVAAEVRALVGYAETADKLLRRCAAQPLGAP